MTRAESSLTSPLPQLIKSHTMLDRSHKAFVRQDSGMHGRHQSGTGTGEKVVSRNTCVHSCHGSLSTNYSSPVHTIRSVSAHHIPASLKHIPMSVHIIFLSSSQYTSYSSPLVSTHHIPLHQGPNISVSSQYTAYSSSLVSTHHIPASLKHIPIQSVHIIEGERESKSVSSTPMLPI